MKISRFFGANSREVMRQVRQVLGPDALIVSNRSVDGGIEVLATLEGAFDDVPQETPRQAAEPASQPPVRHAPPAGAAPQPVSYTHLTLPTTMRLCRSRWWADH